jgi:hypothetical protein
MVCAGDGNAGSRSQVSSVWDADWDLIIGSDLVYNHVGVEVVGLRPLNYCKGVFLSSIHRRLHSGTANINPLVLV